MATPVSNSVPLTGNPLIDGLTQGSSWQFGAGPHVITYSLNVNDTIGGDGQPYGGRWDQYPALHDAVDRAFAAWGQYIDVTFQKVGVGEIYTGSTADIGVILTGDELAEVGILAGTIYPDTVAGNFIRDAAAAEGVNYPKPEGDIVLSNFAPEFTLLGPGGIGFVVLMHEIGHALGLKHTDDDGGNGRPTFAQLGIAQLNDGTRSLMSSALPEWNPPTGSPLALDVFAAQHIYGARQNVNAGDSTYLLQSGNARSVIWDTGGIDTIDASGVIGGTIDLTPGVPFGGLVQNLGQFPHGYTIAYGVLIENVIGSTGSDVILGNDLDNVLDGGIGDDTLRGGSGADVLKGGLGKDNMDGGPGSDVYFVDDNADVAAEGSSGAHGEIDTVYLSGSITIFNVGAGIEIIDALNASAIASLVANNSENVIRVRGNTHTQVRGSQGDDTYELGGYGANAIENPGEGVDTVIAPGYVLGANIENLWFTSGAGTAGVGNALDNQLTGNELANSLEGQSGSDTILGGDGDDLLSGSSGNDLLDGGTGFDIMIGGANNDIYVVDALAPSGLFTGARSFIAPAIDQLSRKEAKQYFLDESAFEQIFTSDYDADGLIDRVSFRFDESLFFNTDFAVLDGPLRLGHQSVRPENLGTPNEVAFLLVTQLEFGPGNEILAFSGVYQEFSPTWEDKRFGVISINAAPLGDVVYEMPNDGNDTVRSSIDYSLPDNVETLELTGGLDLNGAGNSAANTLTGNGGHNRLLGRGGDDALDGDDGWDTAVYTGASYQYALIEHKGTVRIVDRVADRDGVDTTRNIEQAKFEGDNVTSLFTAADIFSPLEYIASYADLMAGFAANAQMGYEHFLAAGSAAMRTATFDGLEYLASQPDLIAGFGMDRDAATVHYIQSGRFEGRTVSFNGLEYLASYTDLVNSFGVNEDLGTMHYLTAGRNEGRTVTFRGLEYLASNPDLMAGYGDNFELATIHYIASGRFEGRVSSFHALEYIASYADLIQGIGANINAGALHYINSGRFEGRTEHFDAAQYLANYADLAAGFGNNHELAALHFIQHGFYEGRTDQVI